MHCLFNFRIESIFLSKEENVIASIGVLSARVWVNIRRMSLSSRKSQHRVIPSEGKHLKYLNDHHHGGEMKKEKSKGGFDAIPEQEESNRHE